MDDGEWIPMRAIRLVLVLAAALLLALVGYAISRGNRTEHWPAVSGQLDKSYIVTFGEGLSAKAGNMGDTSIPIVRYRYTVTGAEYTGTSISSWDSVFHKRSEAQQVLARIPSSGVVRVYYNPDRPDDAILIAGPAVKAISELVFASVACCFLALLLPRMARWLYADYQFRT